MQRSGQIFKGENQQKLWQSSKQKMTPHCCLRVPDNMQSCDSVYFLMSELTLTVSRLRYDQWNTPAEIHLLKQAKV